jgi:hypothetical protein
VRRLKLILLAVLLVSSGQRIGAQTTPVDTTKASCPTTLSAQTAKVCNAALDGVTMLHPVAALLISGGNPVLGTAATGAGGRFGHFHLMFRATTAVVVVPDFTYDGTKDTVPVARKLSLYAPRVDLSTGLIAKQMPMGTVSLDFVLSALLIKQGATTLFTPVKGSREISGTTVSLDWGIRAAMVSKTMPTASLSIIKRGMPSITMGSLTGTGLAAYTFDASAINVRLLLGKQFHWFEFAVGGGADLLSGNAEIAYRNPVTGITQTPIKSSLSGMRLLTVLDLGAHLGPIRLGVEGGYQAGSKLTQKTIFAENNVNAGKFYGGFGVGLFF